MKVGICCICKQERLLAKKDKCHSCYKRLWRQTRPNENAWKRWRFHNDMNYRIYHLFGGKVNTAIKKGWEFSSFEKITGYSFNDFKKHLENNFKPGMNWENYGKAWNIDHIIGRRHFDYESVEDPLFKEFWNLANIQPLFVRENMRKQEFDEVPSKSKIGESATLWKEASE